MEEQKLTNDQKLMAYELRDIAEGWEKADKNDRKKIFIKGMNYLKSKKGGAE